MTEAHSIRTPELRRQRPAWPVLTVLTAATFCTVTAELLPSGLLPAMSHDLGVSPSAIGALVSAWAVTIALVGIPLVRLTLRVPRHRLLTVSLVVTAVANLVTASAPGFGIALSGRIVAASAHGLFWALVVSYVATIVEPRRLGRALAVVLAGPTLAGLAGLPAAALLADQVGWRVVAAGISVGLLLTAAGVWLVVPAGESTALAQEAAGGWDRSARGVVIVAAGGGLVLIGHFAAFTYITTLVIGHGGLGSSAIPAMLLALGLAGGLGVAASGLAADRFPRAALVVAPALISGGLALVLIGAERAGPFVAGTLVWGAAIGAFPPILQARVLRLSSASFRPVAGSIVVTVLNLGVAIGATVGGLALAQGERTLVAVATAAAAAGTLALAVSLRSDAGSGPGSPSPARRTRRRCGPARCSTSAATRRRRPTGIPTEIPGSR